MGTVTSSDLSSVQSLAKRVATLRPRTYAQVALVAFMAGALHSLVRAIQCHFDDQRMTPDLANAAAELEEVLGRIMKAQEPTRA